MNNHDFFVKYSNLYPSAVSNNIKNTNINNNNANDKNHFKSLKLFKDIKILKCRIENDH